MALRLGILGAALVVAGALNIGGFGVVTAIAGGVVLLGAGTAWLVTRRRPTSR
ncbi:MAG TPA: hypothetical protein VGN37_24830 [Actinocatenispora sp.]